MQRNIGYKKEMTREILKVRINGKTGTLKYSLLVTVRTPPAGAKNRGNEEFFTLHNLVEPMGVEPTTSRVRF